MTEIPRALIKKTRPTADMSIKDFDLSAGIVVGFYNSENYDTYAEAAEYGAEYEVNSSISLYGEMGLFELQKLANAMTDCSGAGKYTPAVKSKKGVFVDIDKILKLV